MGGLDNACLCHRTDCGSRGWVGRLELLVCNGMEEKNLEQPCRLDRCEQ